uniref:hypothetical protein n=1 Tax=Marinobacterium profundum TaxID=1714300 RepID=UPI0013151083|nr:hypothetical protein [Marinobacterium profundum]
MSRVGDHDALGAGRQRTRAGTPDHSRGLNTMARAAIDTGAASLPYPTHYLLQAV